MMNNQIKNINVIDSNAIENLRQYVDSVACDLNEIRRKSVDGEYIKEIKEKLANISMGESNGDASEIKAAVSKLQNKIKTIEAAMVRPNYGVEEKAFGSLKNKENCKNALVNYVKKGALLGAEAEFDGIKIAQSDPNSLELSEHAISMLLSTMIENPLIMYTNHVWINGHYTAMMDRTMMDVPEIMTIEDAQGLDHTVHNLEVKEIYQYPIYAQSILNMAQTSANNVAEIVCNQLLIKLIRALNHYIINGEGRGDYQPTGILNFNAAEDPDDEDFSAIKKCVIDDIATLTANPLELLIGFQNNLDVRYINHNAAWFMSQSMLNTLRSARVVDQKVGSVIVENYYLNNHSSGDAKDRSVINDMNVGSGFSMLGYPVVIVNQLSDNSHYIVFGDMKAAYTSTASNCQMYVDKITKRPYQVLGMQMKIGGEVINPKAVQILEVKDKKLQQAREKKIQEKAKRLQEENEQNKSKKQKDSKKK